MEIIGIIASTSIMMATNGINVAHELGHRKSFFSRTCSKLLLMPSQYMHFYIEHNFGHHVNVGTEEDPATAKYKQSLYSFWVTSVIGQYISAWKLQLKLLKISKHHFFSIKNDMMFYVIFQLLFICLIYYNYGITVTIYSLIISVISFLFLETINYIEHYGLSRKKDQNGRYERVKTIHSWNSNHVVGDKVYLQCISPKQSLSNIPIIKSFIVSDVFFSGLQEYDNSLVYISLNDSRSILSRRAIILRSAQSEKCSTNSLSGSTNTV